ncbi:MAG: hypothetical protein ABI763_06955 [Bacteroidota bacterium]
MKITLTGSTLLLVVIAFISFTEVEAQTTFVRMYNEGNMGYTVREVNGNSYVVAGGTDFYYNWHWNIQSSLATTNIHLFKTNVNGVLQWEQVISKLNSRMVARWMEPTFDDGFIITGSTNSDVTWPPDSNDVVLVKTDGNGVVAWSKTYDSGKDDLGFGVQQTSDSGYIISGFHDSLPVSLAMNTYILLIKTDALGNVQWEKKYQFAVRDFNTHEPFSYVVKQTGNGGYIVVGTNAITHPADVDVLRTDASGNVIWAKSYEHDASVWRNSVGLDIIETSNGDFVIAGSMDKDTPLHLNYPYFMKIDNAGAVLKQRFYETVPVLMFQSGFSSVEETTDGGFFFTGMGGYSDFGDQAQLLKTDVNLDMTWSRVYSMDGMATVGSMSGRETSDGGYVFSGKRQLSGSMLMKTNGIGLVACKVPNSLIEFTPSVAVSNWNPIVISGIIASSVLLTETSPLVDTTIVCPVAITPLPVELNYFSAAALPEQKVTVDWMTASEINNDYFIIERSKDNFNFEDAGKIAGAGNSTSLLSYGFIDEKPFLAPVSYYRLRQVDYDGSEHFSNAVPVAFRKDQLQIISAYPDRETNSIKVIFAGAAGEKIQYSLSDVFGKTIVNRNLTAEKSVTLISIDMINAAAGIYFLTMTGQENKAAEIKITY